MTGRHPLRRQIALAIAATVAVFSHQAMMAAPPRPATTATTATPATTQADDPLVTLNFPPNTPLAALVSYVSERLGINFVYDEGVAGQPITLRTPTPVHQSELLDVLVNVLQAKNLILEDTTVPHLKRIISAQMPLTAPPLVRPEEQVHENKMVTRFIATQHMRPEQLLPLVTPMLSKPAGRVAALPEKQAIVITDYASNAERIIGLIKALDAAPEPTPIRTVQIRYGQAKQIGQTLQTLMQSRQAAGEPMRQMVVIVPDEATNQILLSGPAEEIDSVAALIPKLDLPAGTQQVVRFYKLTNTVAADMLTTLRALEGQEAGGTITAIGASEAGRRQIPRFGSPLPGGPQGEPVALVQTPGGPAGGQGTPAGAARPLIVADENSNTIIVNATPDQQTVYEQIIQKLDQRRPQVMLETTVVSLDTSNSFELGVNVGIGHEHGKIISFSSFGISEVDSTTGRLTPIDAPGGTLALLSPEIADVVIRALSTSSHSRRVSMPRVLVNDNSTGKLNSVSSEPFQRTVITDATTIVGEGSNAEAGTTIDVTPHISNGDYLQLEYSVELSNFTGQSANNLPPPSQRNTVSSKVTIPDGHTIVVGGLNRSDYHESVSAVPILSEIPILEYLFRDRSKTRSNTTLFVFIRPTILRDDQFRDLKYLSRVDRKAATAPDDLPESDPLVMLPAQ